MEFEQNINFCDVILSRLKEVCTLNIEARRKVVDFILQAQKIFVFGAGRSGLVLDFWSMRMMHGGFSPYLAGSPRTPSMGVKDILVVVSGSGKTDTAIIMANKAKKCGSKILLVTTSTSMESPLAKIADLVAPINIGDPFEFFETPRGHFVNVAPMGTVFELSALIFFEGIIAEIIYRNEIKEEEMKSRHKQLE